MPSPYDSSQVGDWAEFRRWLDETDQTLDAFFRGEVIGLAVAIVEGIIKRTRVREGDLMGSLVLAVGSASGEDPPTKDRSGSVVRSRAVGVARTAQPYQDVFIENYDEAAFWREIFDKFFSAAITEALAGRGFVSSQVVGRGVAP